jgi:REP element-mobilizing transposase RayT
MRTASQLELPIRSWGGRRPGAGRKSAPGRRDVPHRRRGVHDPRCPAHVTLRARPGLPSLRGDAVFAAVRAALAASSTATFRVVHWSIQADHVHLLVEADGHLRLIRGLQGLAVRVARAANRALKSRGSVWADRYHVRRLSTPREVRHALVYVLQNWRKHIPGARGLDPRSSAAWFPGWRVPTACPSARAPVVRPRTWLAAAGGGATAWSVSTKCRRPRGRIIVAGASRAVPTGRPTPSPRVPSSLPPRAQTK